MDYRFESLNDIFGAGVFGLAVDLIKSTSDTALFLNESSFLRLP